MNSVEIKTKGLVIRHKKPRWYNIQQFLNGAWLIYRQVLNLIDLRDSDKLLDVGCGTGTVLFKLRQKNDAAELHGIDPSESMIRSAQDHNQKTNGSVKFEIGVGEHLDFKDEKFDWVISSLTFHHLPFDVQVQTIREMKRVLKPGGRLLITDFGKVRSLLGKAVSMTLRSHAFSKDTMSGSVKELVEKENFKEIKREKVQFGIVEHLSGIRP